MTRMRSSLTSFRELVTVFAAFLSLLALYPAMAQDRSGAASPTDGAGLTDSFSGIHLSVSQAPSTIWKGAVGDGFRRGVFEAGGAVGLGIGMRVRLSER